MRRWAGHVARTGETRSAYKTKAGKHLGRLRLRWEDNIKMNLENMV
jgi:hypothetical protein